MQKEVRDLIPGDVVAGRIVRSIEPVGGSWCDVHFTDNGWVPAAVDDVMAVDEPIDGMHRNFASFVQTTIGGSAAPDRIILDATVNYVTVTGEEELPPVIILRHGSMMLVLQPQVFVDQVALDVVGFICNQQVRLAAIGREGDQDFAMGWAHAHLPTSHGWPATTGMTVLLGEQGEAN